MLAGSIDPALKAATQKQVDLGKALVTAYRTLSQRIEGDQAADELQKGLKEARALAGGMADPAVQAAVGKQIDAWEKMADLRNRIRRAIKDKNLIETQVLIAEGRNFAHRQPRHQGRLAGIPRIVEFHARDSHAATWPSCWRTPPSGSTN